MTLEFIQPTDCMGDSLYTINNNTLQLSGTITNNYNNLFSLIKTLSTNMNTIQNVPYVRYAKSNAVAITNPINVGSGSQIYKVIMDEEEVNLNMPGVSIDTITGVMTLPAGTYEARIRMANFTASNVGTGFNLDLALRRTGTSTYTLVSVPVHANTATPNFDPISTQGRFSLSVVTELELCIRTYSASNVTLNVGGGTAPGSSNQFIVEFYKVL